MDVVCGCLGDFLFQVLCGALCDWCCKNSCHLKCCQCDEESCQWCNQHCDNACSHLEQSCQNCNCSRVLEYCFCLPCCDYACERCNKTDCCYYCLYCNCCFPDESEPKLVTTEPRSFRIPGSYETMSNRCDGYLVTEQNTNSRRHGNYEVKSNRKDGGLYPSPSAASNLMILSADALEENCETMRSESREQSDKFESITTHENILSEDPRRSSNSMTNTHDIDNKEDKEEGQNRNTLIKPEYKETTV